MGWIMCPARTFLGMLVTWLVTAPLVLLPEPARAACECRCIDGEVRALCSSTLDLDPVCAPRICPPVPPSIAPIQAPRIPPIGTTSCRQVQMEVPRGRYEWREVCLYNNF